MKKAYLFRPNDMGEKSCNGIAKFSKTGITVVQSGVNDHPSDPQLCIRWGCSSSIPAKRNVLNKLECMRRTQDKGGFRLTMAEKGLAPFSWSMRDFSQNFNVCEFPCVVRPSFHAKAKDFYLCKNPSDFLSAISRCGGDWYASRFIEKKAEYRINVLQGRVLCVIEKSPEDAKDVTWSRGTTSILYWSEWVIDAVRKAVEAVKLSGLDFAGVDVILDKDDKAYVLELNTLPYLEGNYQQQCFAKGFDWVVTNHRDTIPTKGSVEDWKKYIHPAMSDLARI